MDEVRLDVNDARELTVGEVMLSRPKTLPVDATAGDLRQLFAKDTVRTALLVDGSTFVGVVERDDIPESASADEPALSFVRTDSERVGPGTPVRDVIPYLERSPEGRLVVVDEDGKTLRGLVCLKRTATGVAAFCVAG